MSESEVILLERFVRGSDAGAFAEIVRRHAGLVYGTCLRVLADADKAADATQETFFHLLKRADGISGSVPGWLHRVAVSKAVDLVRSDSRRRQRERQYAGTNSGADVTWREICPYVDEALDRLDDETREVLVGHYLEGRSMTALADGLGVSRPTVSRRIEAGLMRLRAQLGKRGVTVAVAGLGALLAENAARGAPAYLIGQLGKVSLLGAGAATTSASGGAASGSGLLSAGVLAAANTKLIVTVGAVVVVGAGLLTYTLSSRPPEVPEPVPVAGRDGERPQPRTNLPRPDVAIEEAEPAEERRDTPSEEMAEEPPAVAPASGAVEPSVGPPTGFWQPDGASEPTFELDLSSPEGTARSFVKAIIFGDTEKALACWFETAVDYDDIRRGMESQPGDPDYEAKMWFQSLDPDAEIPIVWSEDIEGGMELEFRVTLKKDASMRGRTYCAGDTEDIRITVRPSGDLWLIDNM